MSLCSKPSCSLIAYDTNMGSDLQPTCKAELVQRLQQSSIACACAAGLVSPDG